jgi:hypothetical protein
VRDKRWGGGDNATIMRKGVKKGEEVGKVPLIKRLWKFETRATQKLWVTRQGDDHQKDRRGVLWFINLFLFMVGVLGEP